MANLLRPLRAPGLLATLITLLILLTVACGAAASAAPTPIPPVQAVRFTVATASTRYPVILLTRFITLSLCFRLRRRRDSDMS